MNPNYLPTTPNTTSNLDRLQPGDILVSNRSRTYYAVITKTTSTTIWYTTIERAYTPDGGLAPSRHDYSRLMEQLDENPEAIISTSTRKTVHKTKNGYTHILNGVSDGAKYYVPWDGNPVTEISD
jgi:hypothetical protein